MLLLLSKLFQCLQPCKKRNKLSSNCPYQFIKKSYSTINFKKSEKGNGYTTSLVDFLVIALFSHAVCPLTSWHKKGSKEWEEQLRTISSYFYLKFVIPVT